MPYEAVIGLEVHAELATRSKMFCACPVVEPSLAAPNTAVCPVCAGMPGTLPVLNECAVEFGLRVALALGCTVPPASIFARKNYFYPDLPKGYQISQYEQPLAVNGLLVIDTRAGEKTIRIRRVHLEEDTGKLTHIQRDGQAYSLVDLNRAGVPLLEIVTEPDLRTLEEVRAYATQLRAILRALGVSSGDLEKGAIRFEANISLRPAGSAELGTRVEIKNLNSFRLMERALGYEIERQTQTLENGGKVAQETVGWDEAGGFTFSQRSKEEAHDYRYFPEPDLPPLVIDPAWLERIRASLPELPRQRARRLRQTYGLTSDTAALLAEEKANADYFEAAGQAAPGVAGQVVANWVTGELFAWLNQNGASMEQVKVTPNALAELLALLAQGALTTASAKSVLEQMLASGQSAAELSAAQGLRPISDAQVIAGLVAQVLAAHPQQVAAYRAGKVTLANWFFGQVMQAAGGRAEPALVRGELERQLKGLSE